MGTGTDGGNGWLTDCLRRRFQTSGDSCGTGRDRGAG